MAGFEDTPLAILINAQIAVELLQAHGVEADFGEASLAWLETHIDEQRDTLTEERKRNLVDTVGAYFGTCLCFAYEGDWVQVDESWGVSIGDLTAFPFSKVIKFIEDGAGDSFASLFSAIPTVIEHARLHQDADAQDEDQPEE